MVWIRHSTKILNVSTADKVEISHDSAEYTMTITHGTNETILKYDSKSSRDLAYEKILERLARTKKLIL